MFDTIIDVTRDIRYADEDETIQHYGTQHKSGRYPWGSGVDPAQRNRMFVDHVNKLRKDGLSDPQIAEGMGIKSTQFRAKMSIAGDSVRRDEATTALKLKNTGMSNVAIGKEMGKNESTIRSLLAPATQEKEDILLTTANVLRNEVREKAPRHWRGY
jgi:DNA-binding CsgD family transcriptional regulator